METVVYKVRDPQGREREIRGPAGASDAEIVAQAQKLFSRPDASKQIADDAITRGAKDFNADASFGTNFLAGAGKAVSDLGLGVRQLFGGDVQAEVDDRAKRDKALMSTGGGLTGNIATQTGIALLPGAALSKVPATAAVGKALLSPAANIPGILTGAATGAAQSALQPVETGGSRAANAAVGGIAGAVVPAAMMALKTGGAVVEPLSRGGRDRIVGRTLNEAAGPDRSAVVAALANAGEVVPGSLPTAAEASGNAGIAAMQRTASAINPTAYAERALDQNAARVAALRGIAGESGDMAAAIAARDAASKPAYEVAKQATVQADDTLKTLLGRPSLKSAWARAERLAAEQGETIGKEQVSGKGLHYLKLALDDLIDTPQASGIGKNELRALMGTKKELVDWLGKAIPEYGQGMEAFKAGSKPINRMQVGEELLRLGSPLPDVRGNPTIYPAQFGRQTRDLDALAQKATGFDAAKASSVLKPEDVASIQAIRQDLARALAAQNAGRGAGSDTVQKLAMTNIMQRSGLPTFMADLPGVSRVGKWVYSGTDEMMRDRLAQALLDPKTTAALMDKATPSAQRKAIVEALAAAGQAGMLGSAATLNAPQ